MRIKKGQKRRTRAAWLVMVTGAQVHFINFNLHPDRKYFFLKSTTNKYYDGRHFQTVLLTLH